MNSRILKTFFIIILFLTFNFLSSKKQEESRYNGSVFELREDLSIGVADGPDEYMFFDISDIDQDSKGNIYVLDYMYCQIKVFNNEGKYLKTIGRKGSGPGEFRTAWKIFIDEKDYLYTTDLNLRRLTVFNQEGVYDTSYTFPKTGSTVREFFVDQNSNFILIDSRTVYIEQKRKATTEINYYSKDMKLIRNIFTGEGISANRSMRRPFPCLLSYSYIKNGKFVYGVNDKYTFFIDTLDKNTVEEIIREFKPLKVNKNDKDKYFEFTRLIPDKNRIRDIINNTNFPKYKPPYEWILADDTGFIIMGTYEMDKNQGQKCDLYDFEGRYLKKIHLKNLNVVTDNNNVFNLKFKHSNIYANVRTEEGFAKAVRFKLVKIKD